MIATTFFNSAGKGWQDKQSLEDAQCVLNGLGLGDRADQRGDELSFGERKLLEICRALFLRPRLLLLDEPFAGLNVSRREQLLHLLSSDEMNSTTICVIEHNIEILLRVVDQIFVMREGRIAKVLDASATSEEEIRCLLRL